MDTLTFHNFYEALRCAIVGQWLNYSLYCLRRHSMAPVYQYGVSEKYKDSQLAPVLGDEYYVNRTLAAMLLDVDRRYDSPEAIRFVRERLTYGIVAVPNGLNRITVAGGPEITHWKVADLSAPVMYLREDVPIERWVIHNEEFGYPAFIRWAYSQLHNMLYLVPEEK